MSIIKLENLTKSYGDHLVLDSVDLEIEKEKITVVTGPSGAGKSTLLNVIGLLEKSTSGDIYLFGEKNVKPYSRKAIRLLRDKIGYLFQNFALIDNETVENNLKIALEYVKGNKKDKIKEVLEKVGLEGFEKKKIYECSGGEQQRIAIARLMLKPCEVILADEPTGSLDDENKDIVFNLLRDMQKDGKTIIVVTHDTEVIEKCDINIPIEKLERDLIEN